MGRMIASNTMSDDVGKPGMPTTGLPPARANNVGWRIDYQLATPSLKLKSCAIHPEPRFSDHAPYAVDYAL